MRGPQARIALFAAVVVVVVAGAVIVMLGRSGEPSGPRVLAPGRGTTDTTRDPFAYDADRRADFEARAAAGLSHVLYAKSPGGVLATAQRVQRLRPAIEDVAARAHQDPDTLEGIVFLESGGFPATKADLESSEFKNFSSPYFGGQKINEVLTTAATQVSSGWEYLPYQLYAETIFSDTAGQAYVNNTDLNAGLRAWQDALVEYGNEQGFTVNAG